MLENRKHKLIVFFLLVTSSSYGINFTLNDIDSLIQNRHNIQMYHQARIDSVYQNFTTKMNSLERFLCYGQLFDMYRAFNVDSQLCYAQKRIALSMEIGLHDFMQVANMNRAEVLMRSGMYHEAIICLDSISSTHIDKSLHPYYYHLRRTLYGLMKDFSITTEEQNLYHHLTQNYRDSLLLVHPKNSFLHTLVNADALYALQRYDEALLTLDQYELTHTIKKEEIGVYSITKAQIYRAIGNKEKEKQHLIISASADLKGASREYIALRELATMLYKEGDIDRAHKYMQCAIEDANAGGLRGRTLEVSAIYPIIESAYTKQTTLRERLLYSLIVSIAVITLLMGIFLLYYAHQRKKLTLLNILLKETNQNLNKSNQIKTVYVGHYMEMTSLLIDRFDTWRKTLNQAIKDGNVKLLQAEVSSQRFTQEQLNTFYHDFDEAFLNIFPDFIDKVKGLLVDGTEFRTKPGERLNTDLRVLCCIRLGIIDSTQIASFLRYSLSTIYNSRTRMRNLAKEDRESFEEKITTL